MRNEIKKKLEDRFDEFSHINYLKTDSNYNINSFEAKTNFLILWDKSESNMAKGEKGFISAYGVDRRGRVFVELNQEGLSYFNEFVAPIISNVAHKIKLERYSNKLFGKGQKNDFTEDGPVPGVKFSPSILEHNFSGSVDNCVDVPMPDEAILGPRGESLKFNVDMHNYITPSSDIHDYVMSHFDNN